MHGMNLKGTCQQNWNNGQLVCLSVLELYIWLPDSACFAAFVWVSFRRCHFHHNPKIYQEMHNVYSFKEIPGTPFCLLWMQHSIVAIVAIVGEGCNWGGRGIDLKSAWFLKWRIVNPLIIKYCIYRNIYSNEDRSVLIASHFYGSLAALGLGRLPGTQCRTKGQERKANWR